MLSETLDNLTRRIAKELDHVAQRQSPASRRRGGSEAPNTPACETSQTSTDAADVDAADDSAVRDSAVRDSALEERDSKLPSQGSATSGSATHRRSSQTTDNAAPAVKAAASPQASMERRPANPKQRSGQPDRSAATGPDEAPGPSDWRRTHIN